MTVDLPKPGQPRNIRRLAQSGQGAAKLQAGSGLPVVFLPGIGHLPQIQTPALVARLIVQTLLSARG